MRCPRRDSINGQTSTSHYSILQTAEVKIQSKLMCCHLPCRKKNTKPKRNKKGEKNTWCFIASLCMRSCHAVEAMQVTSCGVWDGWGWYLLRLLPLCSGSWAAASSVQAFKPCRLCSDYVPVHTWNYLEVAEVRGQWPPVQWLIREEIQSNCFCTANVWG